MPKSKTRRPDFRKIMGGEEQTFTRTRNGVEHEVTDPAEPGDMVHLALREAIAEAFTDPGGAGYVSKDALLSSVVVAPDVTVDLRQAASIHWDYILRDVSRELGTEVMGLTGSFFTSAKGVSEADRIAALWKDPNNKEAAVKQANRHLISLSNGKANGDRVRGFSSVCLSNGALVIARIKRMDLMRKNINTGYSKTVVKALTEGIGEAVDHGNNGLPSPAEGLLE